MRILICDNNHDILDDLSKRIKRVFYELKPNENLFISFSDNVFSICDYIESKKLVVDAVFMDVALNKEGGENGIDIAKKVKKEYPFINIIFYTSNIEYAESIFEVDPLWLMLKPATDSKIKVMLQKLIRVADRNDYITIRKVGEVRRVKIEDIYYIESQGKYIKIHTDNECIASINKLDNLSLKLGPKFIRCHKSYIVNINKIKQFTYNKILLFDETEILVSRSYRAFVKETMLCL